MKEKILKIFQENYGWFIALITGCGVFISFVLRFIKYIYSNLYFSYYGLSYGLFKIEELGIIYDFCLSILLAFCFYSLCYCYKQIYDLWESNKKIVKTILFDVFLILISNIYIIVSPGLKVTLIQLLINLLVVIAMEIIAVVILNKLMKNKIESNMSKENYLFNYLKMLPFYLFLLIIILSSNYLLSVKNVKSYRIIDNNKVIVYTTEDYYLLLNCDIQDNKLKIYKGTQTKTDNLDIETELLEFDHIEIVSN